MVFWDIVNLAGVIEGGVLIGEMFKRTDNTPTTSFNLAVGHETKGGGNYGGSVPHVALFDTNGGRIGQYKGDANGHIDSGSTKSITIKNSQNGGHQAQPEYVHITMVEGDAICIAYVNVAGDSVSWSWVGDWAASCENLPWYYSDLKVGSGNYMPNCVWLDQNGSNDIPFNSLSLHISDFGSSDALQTQYDKNRDTLCKSSPRFKMSNSAADGFPYFFSPPLEYNEDGSDKDPSRVIDKPSSKKSRRFQRHVADNMAEANASVDPSTFYPNGANPWPEWLHVSDNDHHSAIHLCSSGSSFGPDFVSTSEGVFCDMSAKKTYPLCSENVMTECFDLDSKTLKTTQGDQNVDNVSTVERRSTQAGRPSANGASDAAKPASRYTRIKNYETGTV